MQHDDRLVLHLPRGLAHTPGKLFSGGRLLLAQLARRRFAAFLLAIQQDLRLVGFPALPVAASLTALLAFALFAQGLFLTAALRLGLLKAFNCALALPGLGLGVEVVVAAVAAQA
ncbi:hypothetical protein D3C77_558520 [compost metagenome]